MKKFLLSLLIAAFVLTAASYAAGKMALGIDTVESGLVMRYDLTDAITGRLGLGYNNTTTGGVSTSTTAYDIRVDYFLPVAFGAAKPLIGVQYANDGAATATTTTCLLLGVEAEVADGVYAGGGIVPYRSTSANTSTIGTAITFISMGFYLF